jgi:hypothetical protein
LPLILNDWLRKFEALARIWRHIVCWAMPYTESVESAAEEKLIALAVGGGTQGRASPVGAQLVVFIVAADGPNSACAPESC